MPELNDDAKAEIAAAVRMVRDDHHSKMIREIHGWSKPKDPPVDPPKPTDPPVDPKLKNDPPPPTDPPAPVKKRSLWALGNDEDD
jgi:hypothetical protein